MKLHVGKWGNSLALRLPRGTVERFNISEGDAIDISLIETALAAAEQQASQERRQAAFEEIRRRRRPLPADYKFDRDEANSRPAMDKW
jgi:antitoxin MazE